MKNLKLQLKIKNWKMLFRLTLFFLTFIFSLLTLNLSQAKAQTLDPSSWQTGATGLRTSTYTDKRTAGLTTIIKASGVPFVSLPSGVKDAGWGRVGGPVPLELGQIKIPATTPALISESADWSHNEMTFSNNLKLWVSRLSPALLIQNQNPSLRLFSGNVSLYTYNDSFAQISPKYVAYSSGGIIQVQTIPASGAIPLPLPVLDNSWILVWYGNNSAFIDTKTPITTTYVPQNESYKADVPMFLKFQSNPVGIIQSPEGGIDLTFAENSGYVSMLPLFGREHPRVSDTEGWGTSGSLHTNVVAKINFWNSNNRLCSFPARVSENYSYNASTDTAAISESIAYLNVCSGGSTTSGFAILPPFLSLAKDSLGSNFSVSGSLTNPSYPTEFGPVIGMDNTNNYTWSVSGLKKYTDSRRKAANPSVAPDDLIQELAAEVDKITQAGHFKPWLFSDETPRSNTRGDIYFLNPADIIYHLTEVAQTLPDSSAKTNLIDYIKSERTGYPPETVYNLPDAGTVRASQSLNNYSEWQRGGPPDIFLKRVPLYSFYGLAKYYDLTAEALPVSVLTAAKNALANDSLEQDWATASWFKGFRTKHASIESINRYLTGVVGFTQLAKAAGDADAESLGRALLVKTALARLAMAKYPRYLYANNLLSLPATADWMPRYTAGVWTGYIWNYSWSTPNDDVSQAAIMDQFGVYLYDGSGFMSPGTGWGADSEWIYQVSAHLSTYAAMVPETFRFLTDFSKPEIEITADKYTTFLPHWYMPNTEAALGAEHSVNHPGDVFQIFMAKSLIQNEPPQNLLKYSSVPWLYDGSDFFYLHKLAETIKSYQGWRWEDEVAEPPLTGDVNSDTQVNVLDIQACVNHILGIQDLGSRADVNGDGSVDVLDVQNIVNIILGA